MRGISYKWRKELAMTGYLETMAALGHTEVNTLPVFDRGNLLNVINRAEAYLLGAQVAKEADLILKYEQKRI